MKYAILIILLLPLALADNGCYLYEDSFFFCKQADSEEVRLDCMEDEHCNYHTMFKKNQPCTNFPECELILCRGNCENELRANCGMGEVPKGETQWCIPGCCKFELEGKEYCQFVPMKGQCESAAKNWGVQSISFDTELNKEQCSASCSQAISNLKQISEPEIPETKEVINHVTESKSSNIYLWIIPVLLALVVGFFIYQKWNYFRKLKVPRIFIRKKKKTNIFSPFSKSVHTEHVKNLKLKHSKKSKKDSREKFLAEAGFLPEKEKDTQVGKLHKLTRLHKMHSLEKEKEFYHLDEVVANIKKAEEAQAKNKKESTAISNLRNLIRKKP